MIFIVYALPKCNTLIQAMLRLIHEIFDKRTSYNYC